MQTLPFKPISLTPETIPTFLTLNSDHQATADAAETLALLRVMARSLSPADLLRWAASQPDGRAALAALKASMQTTVAAVTADRTAADQLLRADAEKRLRLDMAAFRLCGEAMQLERDQRAAAAAARREAEGQKQKLAMSGLSEAEINAVLSARHDGPSVAAQCDADADAAAAEARAFSAFLADPLRDPAQLPAALVDKLHEIAAGLDVLRGARIELRA